MVLSNVRICGCISVNVVSISACIRYLVDVLDLSSRLGHLFSFAVCRWPFLGNGLGIFGFEGCDH